MKEPYFTGVFPQILEYVFCLLKLSKDKIEKLGSTITKSGSNFSPDTKFGDQKLAQVKDEYLE
jgi:hypothetical protein